MKRILLTIFFLSISVIPAAAHPADRLFLAYSPKAKELHVEVYHDVAEPYQHYIDRISIQINNSRPQIYPFHGQEKSAVVLQDFKLPQVTEGDVIHVTAHCHVYGTTRGSLFLTQAYFSQEKEWYEARVEKKQDQHFKRVLHDFRYDRHHPHVPFPDQSEPEHLGPELPGNRETGSDARRDQLELEQEIRRNAHEATFGPLKKPY